MQEIRRLDPALVNKIAAGEVIERPASVVKELTENAVDAGATRIEVALEAGGTRLIRVTDDGHGISREDLPLAVASHATSKIYSTEDLFSIHTLGFRGEALASIASVSQLRICSRRPEQLEGYELLSADQQGEAPAREPTISACAAAPGTTIEVRNLFYNVPARRKFMRQPQTECGHVTEQIARLSLAHPEIAFVLTHNGRTLRNLPSTENRRDRLGDFYGAKLAECLMEISREERDLSIQGFIAPPANSRGSSKWQYVFLNGRYISDRRIGFAIREAFRGLVEHDRYPVVFLFLQADPNAFDVNVHPTKIEVRWRDAGLVQSQVLAVLRETLLSHDLTPKLRPPGGYQREAGDANLQERARRALADYLKRVDPTQARLSFRPPPFPTDRLRPSIAGTLHTEPLPPRQPEAGQPVDDTLDRPASESTAAELLTEQDNATSEPEQSNPEELTPPGSASLPAMPPGQTVMQIHNTYLVAQTDDGVIIIDQHALHERILYERFRERILDGPLQSQGLLIPETFEGSPGRMEAARANGPLLKNLGIEVSEIGPDGLAVQSFPVLLERVQPATFVADLLDRLSETGNNESEETTIHAALDMMACKAAVKAGDPLTPDEMHALLAQRHLTERSSNCPHGRPTTLELTTYDLERQFKRA